MIRQLTTRGNNGTQTKIVLISRAIHVKAGRRAHVKARLREPIALIYVDHCLQSSIRQNPVRAINKK